jgi:thiamine-monophosphate kinase
MEESQLIKTIRKRAGNPGKALKKGIGDDCAVFERDKKSYLLWCQDMMVEGTHFRVRDGYRRIGRKAVAVNISDIAAMGGVPEYITVSLGVPKYARMKDISEIYEGIFDMCRGHGIKLAGGDTVRSGKIVIDVSMIGRVIKKRLALRSGAKPGQLIVMTGPVRNGRKEHLDFTPRLKESRFLAENYRLGAMIDTSDGIAVDIGHICRESRVGCRVYENAIPLSAGLTLKDALYYGESFELIFTMTKGEAERLFRSRRLNAKCHFFIVGETTTGQKMEIIRSDGRAERLEEKGFEHLGRGKRQIAKRKSKSKK